MLYVYAKGLARAIVDPGAEEEAGKHHVREAQSRPNDVEGFNLLVRPCNQPHCGTHTVEGFISW